ncbi:MAG: hypothetical protein QOI11_3771, partial [Candidatus Eremiobacteraeota bacterium]|nr:hypothetical protein [Candidatus Eremiobacteraeota bacterium]
MLAGLVLLVAAPAQARTRLDARVDALSPAALLGHDPAGL